MEYKIDELYPAHTIIEVKGEKLKLSFLTLRVTVELQELFGDLPTVYKLIEKDGLTIFPLIWFLIKDKSFFDNDINKFKTALFKSDNPQEIGKKLLQAFNEVIYKSMPLVINQKRAEEISKMKGNKDKKPCYAKYYDSIGKRYGTTLESFMDYTLRQVSAMLATINDNQYSELEVQASLAGKKLKPRVVFNNISEEEDKQNEDEAMNRVAELEKAWQENTKGNENG